MLEDENLLSLLSNKELQVFAEVLKFCADTEPDINREE